MIAPQECVGVYLVRDTGILTRLDVYCMDFTYQRQHEYAIVSFGDPTLCQLDESILSILWERKTTPTETVTRFPVAHFGSIITSEFDE